MKDTGVAAQQAVEEQSGLPVVATRRSESPAVGLLEMARLQVH